MINSVIASRGRVQLLLPCLVLCFNAPWSELLLQGRGCSAEGDAKAEGRARTFVTNSPVVHSRGDTRGRAELSDRAGTGGCSLPPSAAVLKAAAGTTGVESHGAQGV